MKVLITGINGFIGWHLARKLSERGHTVSGIEHKNGGVLNKKLVVRAAQNSEIVVHLAALTSHKDIVDNKFETLEINFLGTKNVLDAFTQSKKAKKFLYASTGKVYGKIVHLPISEDHPTNPLNILGKSKSITEKLIDFYANDAKEFIIFRIFNVYGPGQKENFLIPTILKQLEKGNVLALGDTRAKRDHVYIDDAIDACVRVIEKKEARGLSIYNICTGVGSSAKDIVDIIRKIKGVKMKIKVNKNLLRHDEMDEEYGTFQKAKRTFGWEPKNSLEEGLAKMIHGQMQAIVMAGGRGTRMRPLSDTTPKLLIPLAKKPFIDHVIEHLTENGCDNIIISTGFLGEQIRKYLVQKNFGVSIKLSMEKKPLGTGGALNLLKNEFEKDFFLIYGDIYTTINLRKMLEFHKKKKALVTAAIHKSAHPEDSDLVGFDSTFKIKKIVRKPHNKIPKNPYNIAAVYVVSQDVKKYLLKKTPYDFVHDLLPKLLSENVPIYGYNTEELMMDIGTPERLAKLEKELRK